VDQSRQPTWQPISALPLIASLIEGTRAGSQEHYQTLPQARQRPYLLDDRTVARVTRVFGEQVGDHWLFEEQLRRCKAESLTTAQRQEIERLTSELAVLRQLTTSILALAAELKSGTIESTLAKSDLQVGLEELLRRADS
jgi:hypothetical protein